MAIIKPENMNFENKNIHMIISGMPGVGKTSIGLSAPNVLLIDCDEGIVRVNPAHRKDSSICKTYEEFLSDIESAKGKYETIVIDTTGALIELIKDWAMRTESSARKKSGGISQQGYGIVKVEYLRLMLDLRKFFNTISLFHTVKEKIKGNNNEDETFYDIICEGSAKNMVWQPADLGAYMHIINGERYLGFTPTANYNAKSAYGIKGLVKVPELKDGEPNLFLTNLFEKVRNNIAAETENLVEKKKAYQIAMDKGLPIIASVQKPQDVEKALKAIEDIPNALTSVIELKSALKQRMAELNIVYDKNTKNYEYAKTE